MPEHDILRFISALEWWPESVKWMFCNGGCYQFYLYVRELFPDAVALYDGDHVLVQVGTVVFDATGIKTPDPDRHMQMDDELQRRASSWAEANLPSGNLISQLTYTEVRADKIQRK